jgi:hypothetical protein
MPVLLTARLTHREDPSNKDVPVIAVGTETSFAPQDGRPQRPFGGVVCRLNPLGCDKGPQRWFQSADVFAERQRVPGKREPSVLQQGVDRRLKRSNDLDQPRTVSALIGKSVPGSENLIHGRAKRLPPVANRPTAFGKRREIAVKMSQTDLTTRHGNLPINPVAVGCDPTDIILAQQGRKNRTVSLGGNEKQGAASGNRSPQPAARAGLLPTGFIDVDVVGDTDLFRNGAADRFHRATDFLTHRGDTPHADRNPEEIVDDSRRLPNAQPIPPVQQAGDRRQLRTKAARGQCRGRHEQIAMGAAHPVRAMFDDLRARDRDLPDLLAARFSFGGQIRRQRPPTTRAHRRAMVHDPRQISRAELDPGVAGVAKLSTSFAARRCRFGPWWGARGIRRGRTRGVSGMLLTVGEKIGKLRLERGEFRLQNVNPAGPDQNLVFEKREISLDLGWQSCPHLGRKDGQFTHHVIIAPGRLLAYTP